MALKNSLKPLSEYVAMTRVASVLLSKLYNSKSWDSTRPLSSMPGGVV